MVITAITLENFKGIKGPCRIELRPLTMLFGANSAGKSSVVQALHYAREIFMRQNTDPDRTLLGGSMDLGGFSSFVYKHDQSLPIKITFDLDLSLDPLPDYYDENASNRREWEQHELREAVGRVETASVGLTIELIDKNRLSPFAGQAAITKYEVFINGEDLASLQLRPGDEQVRMYLNPLNSVFWATPSDGLALVEALAESAMDPVAFDWTDFDEGALFKFIAFYESDIDRDEEFRLKCDPRLSFLKGPIVSNFVSAFPQWGKTLVFDGFFEFHFQAHDYDEPGREEYDISPNLVFGCLTSLITGPGEMVRNDLERMCYLGPIREVPERNNTEVKSPDPSRWANGLAAWDALYSQGEDLIKRTNRWLAGDKRLDSGYRIELEEFRRINENGRLMAAIRSGRSIDAYQEELDEIRSQKPEKRLSLIEEGKNIKVLPQDVGVGISQVVPVVVGSLMADNTILSVEQPELHIHPKLQVVLGDLLIQEGTSRGNCFLIETHSEHLMLRIMKRIRQTSSKELPPEAPSLKPDQVAIYHIRSAEDGTVFKEILIDEEGDFLTRWPGGFFAERSEELFS